MYCKMTREQRLNFVMSADLFASHSVKIASLLCGFSSKSWSWWRDILLLLLMFYLTLRHFV